MDERGLAMVEILVVMAILVIFFASALILSMESFWGSARRSERDIIISTLQRARSRAMANVSQRPWGVCYEGSDPDNPSYKVFSGSDTAPFSSIVIAGNAGVTPTGASALECGNGGIMFAQLTGKTTAAAISVTEGAVTSVVSLNSQGRIDW